MISVNKRDGQKYTMKDAPVGGWYKVTGVPVDGKDNLNVILYKDVGGFVAFVDGSEPKVWFDTSGYWLEVVGSVDVKLTY